MASIDISLVILSDSVIVTKDISTLIVANGSTTASTATVIVTNGGGVVLIDGVATTSDYNSLNAIVNYCCVGTGGERDTN